MFDSGSANSLTSVKSEKSISSDICLNQMTYYDSSNLKWKKFYNWINDWTIIGKLIKSFLLS